jgi:hypothetical protein
MKEENVIVDKSYAFALEVMRVTKLIRDQREYDLGLSVVAGREDGF